MRLSFTGIGFKLVPEMTFPVSSQSKIVQSFNKIGLLTDYALLVKKIA